MIIGILQCDSIRPDYQDRFDNYPEMFQGLIKRAAPKVETIVYDVENNEYPNDIEVCDAYITTGSKASVYEDHNWIGKLQEFIVRLYAQKIKLVAVCFGHQLVAQALGGKTIKSDKGWGVGVHTIDIHTPKPWMRPKQEKINVLVSHQDQVVALPTGAELIAGNTFCPNSMFVLNDQFLCMQGHPEFSVDYAKTMMKTRRDIIGKETYERAVLSLKKSTDELILAKWIVQFCSNEY